MDEALAALPTLLDTLLTRPVPNGGVLSVYLDTTPARVAGQAYLLAYRDRCRELRAVLPGAERAAFETAAARIERYLGEQFTATHPGLAIFASPEASWLHAAPLPAPPAEELAWDRAPHLLPLLAVLDDQERVATVLFDKESARLFTIYLGAIEEHVALRDAVPGKHRSGGWFALAQSRFARQHELQVLRHAQHTTATLTRLLRERPFDRLFLAGPDEALAVLEGHLPRPLRARLNGRLRLELFATDHEVLQVTLARAAEIERDEEVAAVTRLMDAATTPRVALGLAATLAALGEGRVYHLLLADDFRGAGGECPRCGRLVPGADVCPACGEAATPLASLAERLVEQARAQGARVEIVRGEAAALLQLHNGVGAWTRY